MRLMVKLFFALAMMASAALPPHVFANQQHWLELDIATIHQQFTDGTLSSVELTRFYLQRIQTLDQSTGLNAVVIINPQALADAEAADQRVAAGNHIRLLEGIPLLIKDNVDVKDLPTTAGSLALRRNIATDDAFLVQQLRAAGAIILGKTNMAEWAFSPNVTDSSAAGITRNPYDLERTPAGSSGGTGAGVSANLAVAGIGTDTGNSIRGPSSHNGLVGIRSTMGLTSRMGVVPLYLRNDVAGPMARTVADAATMLQVLSAADPDDPATQHRPAQVNTDYLSALRTGSLAGKRIGVMSYYTDHAAIDPSIRMLFMQALTDMRNAGAVLVEDVQIPGFSDLIQNNWCNTFNEDVDQYLSRQNYLFAPTSLAQVVETGLYLPSISNSLQNMLATGRSAAECSDLFGNPRNIAFRQAVVDAMDSSGVDILVYPTWSFPPRRIGDTDSPTGDNSQHIAPHTGLPAMTLPMGYGPEGLPAGISLLGRLFSEPVLIAAAHDYEQRTGHRKAPSLEEGSL